MSTLTKSTKPVRPTGKATPPAVGKNVRIAPTVTTLTVEGMTCNSCVQRVERGLKNVPGVADAVVNLSGKRAAVTYDSQTATVTRLVRAIEATGYEAAPVDDVLPDEERERAMRALATAADQARTLTVMPAAAPDADATTRRLAGMGLLTVLLLLGSIALGGLLGDYTMRPHMPMSAMPAMSMPPAHPAAHPQTPMAMPSAVPQQTPMGMP